MKLTAPAVQQVEKLFNVVIRPPSPDTTTHLPAAVKPKSNLTWYCILAVAIVALITLTGATFGFRQVSPGCDSPLGARCRVCPFPLAGTQLGLADGWPDYLGLGCIPSSKIACPEVRVGPYAGRT
jgi:hypothetical protein